jgi:hypothetical protein
MWPIDLSLCVLFYWSTALNVSVFVLSACWCWERRESLWEMRQYALCQCSLNNGALGGKQWAVSHPLVVIDCAGDPVPYTHPARVQMTAAVAGYFIRIIYTHAHSPSAAAIAAVVFGLVCGPLFAHKYTRASAIKRRCSLYAFRRRRPQIQSDAKKGAERWLMRFLRFQPLSKLWPLLWRCVCALFSQF